MPVIPYAWQPHKQTLRIPSKPSKRLNVLGFISRSFPGYFQQTTQSVNTGTVISAFDAFVSRYETQCYRATKRPCIVVLDNASMHRSRAFRDKIDGWENQGVFLYYLPPYSPELNLIEILWKRIKYHWLPLSAYASCQTLHQAISDILAAYGSEYTITFT